MTLAVGGMLNTNSLTSSHKAFVLVLFGSISFRFFGEMRKNSNLETPLPVLLD